MFNAKARLVVIELSAVVAIKKNYTLKKTRLFLRTLER